MSYTGKDNLDVMRLAKNYNHYIFKWIMHDDYKKILDFGAGNGEYCNKIESHKINAVEVDKELKEQLKCYSYDSINEIIDKKFDLIYTLNVLEHIKDDAIIIKTLSNLLENNGIIKILVPAKMELYSKMDSKVGHYRRYEKEELEDLLKNCKLEIVNCQYFDFLGYFATLLYKYIDNSGKINPRSLKIYDKFIFPLSVFIDKITFGKIIGKNLMIIARKKNE